MSRLTAFFASVALLLSGLLLPGTMLSAAKPAAGVMAMGSCTDNSSADRQCCPVAALDGSCHACCLAVAPDRMTIAPMHTVVAVVDITYLRHIVGRHGAPPLPPPRRA